MYKNGTFFGAKYDEKNRTWPKRATQFIIAVCRFANLLRRFKSFFFSVSFIYGNSISIFNYYRFDLGFLFSCFDLLHLLLFLSLTETHLVKFAYLVSAHKTEIRYFGSHNLAFVRLLKKLI